MSTTYKPERIKAVHKGQCIGWFDTLEQAQGALAEAEEEDARDYAPWEPDEH